MKEEIKNYIEKFKTDFSLPEQKFIFTSIYKIFSLFILLSFALVAKPTLTGVNPISSDCKFKGKRLAGEFQIVTHGAEFRVEVVNHGPDLRVRKSNFQGSYSCGEWYFSNHPNAIRIEIVNHAPDFRIEYNQSPGRSNFIK